MIAEACQSSIGAARLGRRWVLGVKSAANILISCGNDHSIAACAAANRAIGIRNGLQLTYSSPSR